MPFPNFYSNRNKASFIPQLQEIFKDEFNLIRIKYNSKINVTEHGLLHTIKVIIMCPTITALKDTQQCIYK